MRISSRGLSVSEDLNDIACSIVNVDNDHNRENTKSNHDTNIISLNEITTQPRERAMDRRERSDFRRGKKMTILAIFMMNAHVDD